MRAIGSSCLAKIAGVHHIGGPYDVYNERVLGQGLADSPILTIGKEIEPVIAKLGMMKMKEKGYHFHLRPGTEKGDGTTLTRFREFGGAPFRDTPDFTLSASKRERKVLMVGEIKFVLYGDKDLYGPEWSQELPEGYLVQAQYHCFIYGVDVCVVFVSFGLYDYPRVYLVKADDKKIGRMIKHAADWWRAHVVKRVPPPTDATKACTDYLKFKAMQDESMLDADLDDTQKAIELHAVKERMKAMKEEEKALSNYFRERIAEKRGIDFGGGASITCLPNSKGTRTLRTARLGDL
tara:strand:+ start:28 stop:906 length:879 start_codon:yes stop_codon:yes gene_type:complete